MGKEECAHPSPALVQAPFSYCESFLKVSPPLPASPIPFSVVTLVFLKYKSDPLRTVHGSLLPCRQGLDSLVLTYSAPADLFGLPGYSALHSAPAGQD